MVSTPISLMSCSAGSVPTQQNHAGEVSKRRAVSGEPQRRAELVRQRVVGGEPARLVRRHASSASASLSTMNAVPRGHISHL